VLTRPAQGDHTTLANAQRRLLNRLARFLGGGVFAFAAWAGSIHFCISVTRDSSISIYVKIANYTAAGLHDRANGLEHN